jgi:hypothetical protein
VAYAELFLRTSLRVSRAQELSADARAVRVAGAPATASALRKIEVLGAAWRVYFDTEVIPVVEQKRLPPLLEGFQAYWRAAQTPGTPAFTALAAMLEVSQVTGEEDTHPALVDRLAAIGDPPPAGDEAPPALDLLEGVDDVQERVVRDLLHDAKAPLALVRWDVVGDHVWVPYWRSLVAGVRPLHGLEPRDLPRALAEWETIAQATRQGPAVTSSEAERRRVARLLAVWLAVKLADAGFALDAPPGMHVRSERDGRSFEPLRAASELADGTISAAQWSETCDAHGL